MPTMIKSLQPISYPNRIDDDQTLLAFKRLIDKLNDYTSLFVSNIDANTTAISKLPTLDIIQKSLSVGGSNPLNVTSLLGVLQMPQGSVATGTHAKRLTTAPQLGAFFYETDRTVLYAGIPSGSATIWQYVAGTMISTFSARPTGLGTTDTGFKLYVTTGTAAVVYNHGFIWNGAAWRFDGDRAGIFVDSAIDLSADGYQECDGTATTYLTAAADLAEVAFTTPDEKTAPSGVYHKSIAAYTGTINAAVAPGISGSTGAPSTTTTVDNTLAGSTVAVGSATHTHGVGTLAVDNTGQPRNLGVLRYFRR